jgi:catechol 2,3-dioxygenase-like lactoylglutathione lyase family enzyme
MPSRIDHVALECFDLARTEAFYGELLGLELRERASGTSADWGGAAWTLLAFALPAGGALDFFAIDGRRPAERDRAFAPVAHVALAVESRAELEALRARLVARGVAIPEEHDHGPDRRSLYCFDPNGHYLELTHRGGPTR